MLICRVPADHASVLQITRPYCLLELVLVKQILERDRRGTLAIAVVIREMANILLAERVKSTSSTIRFCNA